jgi:hypothetical protein
MTGLTKTRPTELTMSPRPKLWLVTAVIYAAFFLWYTDLGGPLGEDEVAELVANMTASGADPEFISFLEKFAREDSGRQFLMLNSIDYNEDPPDVEGAEPGESAEQLMGRYMAHMLPAMLSRASHPVIVGPAVYTSMDVVGIEGAENWDMGAFMRYRSRRSFLEIVTNPEFAGEHHFKVAALDKTIAFPVEPRFYLGDLRLLFALVLLALTALVDSWLMSRKVTRNLSKTQE